MEDFEKVLKGGPWFIGEHYLTIRAWEPYFKPTVEACSKVAVWARLPGLPIELYEMEVLKDIGRAIGPVLRIDATTAAGTRGRYARLCVQVDLDTPLPRNVLIGRFKQDILYEGIGTLCFSCGRIGHRKSNCPYTVKEKVPVGDNVTVSDHDGSEVEVSPCSSSEKPEAGKEWEDYGPWMLVESRKHATRSRAARAFPSKPNPEQAHAFNAKDLGRLRRGAPEANPPSSPPSASSDGKRKSRRFDHTDHMDPTRPLSYDPTVSKAGFSVLPKVNKTFLAQTNKDHLCNVTSPSSNLCMPEATTSSHKPEKNSKLKLGAAKVSNGRQNEKAVGNKTPRKNHAPISVIHSTNSSIPHHDLGVVQSGTNASMEPHFPSDSREQITGIPSTDRSGVARMGQPLVEISNGRSNNSRRKNLGVESTIASFTGSSLTRIKPTGGGPNKENSGGRPISSKFNGVFGSNQADSDLRELPTNKSSDQLKGAANGDYGACDMHYEEQGGIEVRVKGAGLETDDPIQESLSD